MTEPTVLRRIEGIPTSTFYYRRAPEKGRRNSAAWAAKNVEQVRAFRRQYRERIRERNWIKRAENNETGHARRA